MWFDPTTMQWCREWRSKKMASRRQAEEEARQERQRRGMLTGREIFMQSQTAIVDDDTAAADTDMMREIDEEAEIARMEALSLESQRQARIEVRKPPTLRSHAQPRWFLRVLVLIRGVGAGRLRLSQQHHKCFILICNAVHSRIDSYVCCCSLWPVGFAWRSRITSASFWLSRPPPVLDPVCGPGVQEHLQPCTATEGRAQAPPGALQLSGLHITMPTRSSRKLDLA